MKEAQAIRRSSSTEVHQRPQSSMLDRAFSILRSLLEGSSPQGPLLPSAAALVAMDHLAYKGHELI